MKKMYSYVTLLLLASVAISLTSCDDDPWYDDRWYDDWTWGNDYNRRPDDNNVSEQDFWQQMAATIAGQWRGGMRAYQLDEKGYAVDSVDFSTDIEFNLANNNATYGNGTQWDYYTTNNSNEADFTRAFTWSINTTSGDITILYTETKYAMLIPYDEMNLSDRTFTGYLYATDGSEVDDFLFNRYTENNAKGDLGAEAEQPKVMKLKMVMK